MAESRIWESTNLYGRRWTEADVNFYLSLVADWPGTPAPALPEALGHVRAFATSDSEIVFPLSDATPEHWRSEVYALRSDGTPVGGMWGKVVGAVWTRRGTAILPAHRGNRYMDEATVPSARAFFDAGGEALRTQVIVNEHSIGGITPSRIVADNMRQDGTRVVTSQLSRQEFLAHEAERAARAALAPAPMPTPPTAADPPTDPPG